MNKLEKAVIGWDGEGFRKILVEE